MRLIYTILAEAKRWMVGTLPSQLAMWLALVGLFKLAHCYHYCAIYQGVGSYG